MIVLVQSLRLVNAVFAALSVYLAYQKWGPNTENNQILILSMMVFLGVLFANALNNFLDYETDIENNKYVSVSKSQRMWLSRILGVTSLLIIPVFSFGQLQDWMYLLWFLSVLYNLIGSKNKGWWGGMIVSFILAFLMILPLVSKSDFNWTELIQGIKKLSPISTKPVAYFSIIFSMNLVREYLKDVEDVIGDSKFNKKTWAPTSDDKSWKIMVIGLLLITWFSLAILFVQEQNTFLKPVWVFLTMGTFPILQHTVKNQLKNRATFFQKYVKWYLFIGVLTLLL
jgi:4-hydroxybenzoate polyprenyltransferase